VFEADFDPNLADQPGFDPGLAFTPQDGVDFATPNPFEAEAFPLDDDAAPSDFGADMPFATMELDQTVEGDLVFSDDLALDSSLVEPDDYGFSDYGDITLEQPDLYGASDPDLASVGFVDDAAEDLAFEPVEFAPDDLNAPGLDDAEFGDGGFAADNFDAPDFGDPDFTDPNFTDEDVAVQEFGDPGFSDPDFGDPDFNQPGFGDDGFGDDGFDDSPEAANGFLQNGAALIDDEPDATDDFIQEFGSDPSSHVSLAPDQFDEDGSVRRSGGPGLPMKLILGLGLGALILALAGLLLNGLLGRLRQPSPGGDPVVTEPAPPGELPPEEPPVAPAAVEDTDRFRQAVNAAQTAANQAQSANSAAEWQAVADSWASAIALMQQVPESDPNYAVAQQKAVDYQPNLTYAQQNVQRFP
jgi:hypothetical protein